MKHIKLLESADRPLFRKITSVERRTKLGDLRKVGSTEMYMSVEARRWLSSINKGGNFNYLYIAQCDRRGALDPVTPLHVERMVDLITRSHGGLFVKSILTRPYGIKVHKDLSRDTFLWLQVMDNNRSKPFTLRDLPDIEVGALYMKDMRGRRVFIYFIDDDYVIVSVLHSHIGLQFLCDGVTGVLECLATVLPTRP